MEAELLNPGDLVRQGFPGLVFLLLLLGFGADVPHSSSERSNPLDFLQLRALPGQRSLVFPCSLALYRGVAVNMIFGRLSYTADIPPSGFRGPYIGSHVASNALA